MHLSRISCTAIHDWHAVIFLLQACIFGGVGRIMNYQQRCNVVALQAHAKILWRAIIDICQMALHWWYMFLSPFARPKQTCHEIYGNLQSIYLTTIHISSFICCDNQCSPCRVRLGRCRRQHPLQDAHPPYRPHQGRGGPSQVELRRFLDRPGSR